MTNSRVRGVVESFANGWRFLAPAQRQMLLATWTAVSAGVLLSETPRGLWWVNGLVVLAGLAWGLSVARDVREDLQAAQKAREDADCRVNGSDHVD